MKKILVVRHTNRKGSVGGKGGEDALSPLGIEQMQAMSRKLQELGYVFVLFIYSGLNRTKQALEIALEVLGVQPVRLGQDSRFNFGATLTQYLKDTGGFYAEVDRMKSAIGSDRKLTVADALEQSMYARTGRQFVTEAVLELATELKDGKTALVTSHAPWAELAAVDPNTMPYGIGEGDGVLYTVDGDEIVDSVLIEAPIRGGSHT